MLVLPLFAHESCIRGAILVRGGVPKYRLVVDTTRHCTVYIMTKLLSVPQS